MLIHLRLLVVCILFVGLTGVLVIPANSDNLGYLMPADSLLLHSLYHSSS